MAWFLRGVQSAVFHYASCAPCTGYSEGRKRRKAAKVAKKLREKLELEEPGEYHHPEPTGTNPFWAEEIAMGPGPPPQRARKATTSSTRAITTAGTQNSALSKGESSIDGDRAADMRLSRDTLEDDNWNRKRYQREDEHLWGHQEPSLSLSDAASGALGVSVAGFPVRRPATSQSGSYYSVRAPPVNDLHPPVVSLPSPDPADHRWMLQPPPKASIMAGKERASYRSRSGSSASSRVELRLQRQLSMKQMQQKLDRGDFLGLPSLSRGSSHSTLVSEQRVDRYNMPQARPPSSSSFRERRRRDTAMTHSSVSSKHRHLRDAGEADILGCFAPQMTGLSETKVVRVRQSRPCLSTVISSGSGTNIASSTADHQHDKSTIHYPENEPYLPARRKLTSPHSSTSTTQSSDFSPYLTRSRVPLSSSDISSLDCLQDLVSPRALLSSRFVTAPLPEAKIRLPPSEEDLKKVNRQDWAGNKLSIAQDWEARQSGKESLAPRDFSGPLRRDPRLRWSVDF